jgi:hypothetical protein
MKKAIKKKWIAALRSGKYKQGRHRLAHAGRYCCLGVLCEILALRQGNWSLYDAQLPGSHVREMVGLDTAEAVRLANMNDAKMSFKAIADWIEENL